jgi:hypothetical protein
MTLRNFTVYPKKGEPFQLELRRFSFHDDTFTLYDSSDEASENGFLSFENVAAIHETNQRRPKWEDVRCFEIRLLDRSEPLKIFAHYFKSNSPTIEFYWINTRGPDDIRIENIYIALSEVVSITPAGGLAKYVD